MTLARATLTAAADRAHAITRFLSSAGWQQAGRTPLAGDASARRYERLSDRHRGAAVLMDADPARGETVGPFLSIGRHLAKLGLSSPAVLAADESLGLLLLEDLGDDLFARLIERDPGMETILYNAAVDLLAELHRTAAPVGVPSYGPSEMSPLAALAAIWYGPPARDGERDTDAEAAVEHAVRTSLERRAPETAVLVLRDYHAENLLWLPDRSGHARVGLLDFQDAAAGHPGYDLVSLLSDARRDVPLPLRQQMTVRYAAATGVDIGRFEAACAALSAQRNLRILGVFARLSLRDGKPGYVDLIPRVWDNLQRDLTHTACADLRRVVSEHLPPPTAAILDRLRVKAGSCPTP